MGNFLVMKHLRTRGRKMAEMHRIDIHREHEVEKRKIAQVSELCRLYRSSEQIDLVLGAGVSKNSGVPLYLEMALLIAKYARDAGLMPDAPPAAVAFLEKQLGRLNLESPSEIVCQVKPEEVFLFVNKYLYGNKDKILKELVQKTLYKNIKSVSRRLVGRQTYQQNSTLDSIIRFCAVLGGLERVPASRHKIEPNPKVHAILTTNYDCLLEASFATKFRYLLKPVGREDSSETRKGQRLIPVYHIHGYVSVFPPRNIDKDWETPKLVIAEDDYFRTFYNPNGFTDSQALRFFRQRPCLFIGSAMTDMNLRRFLYIAANERTSSVSSPKHFAILRTEGDLKDEFTQSILQAYGVEAIWINNYDEIDDILGQVYTSVEGLTEESWNALRRIERSGI